MPHTTSPTLWTGRTFGIEMEMMKNDTRGNSISGLDLNRALTSACSEPVHGTGGHYMSQRDGQAWEVKYDTTAGWEVTTPPLELDDNGHCAELRAGCDAVSSLRPKITRSCGLHVHVDCADFTWKEVQKLLALWSRYEPFFCSLIPASRHDEFYAKTHRAPTWAQAHATDNEVGGYNGRWDLTKRALDATTESAFQRACHDLGRYSALRTKLWFLTGRVEFRIHSGTVNYDKIRRWVTLMVTLVGRVKASTNGGCGRLARKVRRLARPVGFGPKYVLNALGLGPRGRGAGKEDEEAMTMTVYNDLMAWIPTRQARFREGHRLLHGAGF
jgi:hypothetical protein